MATKIDSLRQRLRRVSVISIFGLRVRTPVIVSVLSVLVIAVTVWWWLIPHDATRTPLTSRQPAPIQNLYQGNGFGISSSRSQMRVSYSFQLQNDNKSIIYVQHMGASGLGLSLIRRATWSTSIPILSQRSQLFIVTFHVTNCALVTNASWPLTFDVRTYGGPWQKFHLYPMGEGNQPWQLTMSSSVCKN